MRNISPVQFWSQLCLNVNLKDFFGHGSVNNPGSNQSMTAQACDEGLLLPVAMRDKVYEALSCWSPSSLFCHFGVCGRLINEDKFFN